MELSEAGLRANREYWQRVRLHAEALIQYASYRIITPYLASGLKKAISVEKK